LRFPDFTGDWKRRNLGETCEIKTGNKDTKNKVDGGKYPFYVRSNTIERIDTYSYEGEAILTSGDGVGVGKNFHYINGKFDYHQRVYALKEFKEGFNAKFIYHVFSEKFYRRVLGLSAKNSVDSVRMDFIAKMKIGFPSLSEQKKIASFLSEVDKKIAQLRQKQSQVEDYKKGVMQQIFSRKIRFTRQDGSAYPDWEEKKLSDYEELEHGDGDWILSKDISEKGEYKIIQLGNIGFGNYVDKELKTISSDKFDELKGTPIYTGDLLINRMVDGSLNCCILNTVGKYVTSVDVCWIRKNNHFNNYFMMSLFLYEKNQHKLLNLSSGSGRVRISKKNLFNEFKFKIPCMEEQSQIANFLSAIDKKIAIVQTQISQTQTFKKGLLQQMFV
jgi:type I restriction enzyme S subunit